MGKALARVKGWPHPSQNRGTGLGWVNALVLTEPRELTQAEMAWLELPPSIQGELCRQHQEALYARFRDAGFTFPEEP